MTAIEWTDQVWNPVVGCSRVSPGCVNCYAERVAHRGLSAQHRGLTRLSTRGPQWTGEVRFVASKLVEPLRWKKPRRVFVNSMSDLFHETLTNEQIAAVFGVMAACPQHTFQVLTKRAERMRDWFRWVTEVATDSGSGRFNYQAEACRSQALYMAPDNKRRDGAWSEHLHPLLGYDQRWPLPNVWVGVTAENQDTANERVPLLLQIPAAVRFVSAEPLLAPIDFESIPLPDGYLRWAGVTGVLQPTSEKDREPDDYRYFTRLSMKLHWVIVGGESGTGARACDVEWVRNIARQCADAKVACFVKQLGSNPQGWTPGSGDGWELDSKGGHPDEWPDDLRVRQFPARST